MVFIEVTMKVAKHKVAPTYLCVRIHFLADDSHFHLSRVQLPNGRVSVANYMPLDDEVAELVDKRLEAPNPEDLLEKLNRVLRRHGLQIKIARKVEDFM